MPFFIRDNKRKSSASGKKKLIKVKHQRSLNSFSNKRLKRRPEEDDEITSDDDEQILKNDLNVLPDDEETAQEKKVRLAKKYLEELIQQKRENDELEDEEEISKAVGLKLKEDVLEAAGVLRRSLADSLVAPDVDFIKVLRCNHHKLTLTCLTISNNEKVIFTASKDCSIVKWSIQGERRGHIPWRPKTAKEDQPGHSSHILSLALSSDDKFLASGDKHGIINIWEPETLVHIKTLTKHRGPVSGLVFRRGTHALYSASHDRLVMSWNLDAMAFAECLGGHHDCITGIDALNRESCITSGGRDEMVIVYVIPEEKQLRFSAHQSSIDGVKLLNEKTFVTFGQNGSLALWTTIKKKPHFTIPAAHGKNRENGEPNWVTASACLVNCDVVASGSMDGYVRLWKVLSESRRLEELFSVPVPGVVNCLAFTSSGSHLVAAVGKEHKLGRWFTEKSAPNALVIIPLR